jgi:flavin reductase (DIM6/NTAB) family NADH-FMN oxidoreductase RutF
MQKKTDFSSAIKTKYPEQIVIAIAKDKKGKPNPVTIGWTMIASGQPPMMAIALTPKRYTTAAIKHSKCFTIAYPSEQMAKETLFFGTHSGKNIDKLAQTHCKTSPAEKINSVIIDDAVANFECVLVKQCAAGDHIIFIGKIVASHINTKKKNRLYVVGPNYQLGGVL